MLRPAVVLVVLVGGLAPAPAGAVVLAPADEHPGLPSVAQAASGGGALVAYATGVRAGLGRTLVVRDRRSGGTYGAPQTAVADGAVERVAPVLRPSGAALMLAPWGPAGSSPDRLLVLRRSAGGSTWTSDTLLAPAAARSYVSLVGWAANRSGDLVALVRGPGGVTLVRAPAVGPITTEVLSKGYDGGVAVGPRGQVRAAVAYGNRLRAWRMGLTGPAGAPQVLARLRNGPDASLAVDARGTATLAFSRYVPPNNIAIAVSRAPAGRPFGAPVVLDRGPNSQGPQVVATGTRTAVAWSSLTSRDSLRVALAGPRGGFGAPLRPAAPLVRLRGEAGRFASGANVPALAAGPDGSIMLAYGYGPLQALHIARLGPGTQRFTAPYLAAPSNEGGMVGPAVLADGTPLVLSSDLGPLTVSSRRRGPPLDLTPPALTTSTLTAADLRRGTLTVTARCPRGCALWARARLTTGGGRDLVISRQSRRPHVIAPGSSSDVTFSLTPSGRDKLAATGRARAVVLLTAVSPAGVSRTVRQRLVVGAD